MKTTQRPMTVFGSAPNQVYRNNINPLLLPCAVLGWTTNSYKLSILFLVSTKCYSY